MKKLCKIASILMLVVMLTGCVKIRAKVVIEDEKTATMSMEMLYSKEMVDSYGMSTDDLKDQLASQDYDEDSIEEISETIDGEKYVGISAIAPEKEVEKMLDELTVRDSNGNKEYTLTLTSDGLGETMDPKALGGANYSLKQMKDMGLEMTISIQMPGKIKESTIGKISGNTVTVDLLELAENADKEVTIVSGEGGNNSILLYAAIGVGVVAIIAVAAIVISKKKKKSSNEENIVAEDTTVEGPSTQDTIVEETTIEEPSTQDIEVTTTEEPSTQDVEVTTTEEPSTQDVEETTTEEPSAQDVEETTTEKLDSDENEEPKM